MTSNRSPNYPNISLSDAILRVTKAYALDRDAPLDRTVAAKHIGYSSRSGASDKTIAAISQFGLFEKAGTGEVRVSQLALDIIHPLDETKRREALQIAAYKPSAFQLLRTRYGAGVTPSKDSAESYLIREGFNSAAITKLYSAYESTCQFLKQEGASDFIVPSESNTQDSASQETQPAHEPLRAPTPQPASPVRNTENSGMQRMLTQGMLSKGSTFEIIVTGKIGPREIDTLIRKLEIDKEILADEDD